MIKLFTQAINKKRLINLTFNSYEKGTISRKCIPFDFGPSRKYKDGLDRFHFYDLESPDGKHNLSVLPNQIIKLTLDEGLFDPAEVITWTPNWFLKRDWGSFS